MAKEDSISVIIPALNEEENIAAAVDTVQSVIPGYFPDYEILIYDDGSTDRTGVIADELAGRDPSRIKVIHQERNQGLGVCYREGAQIAAKEFYLLVHGDNELLKETIEKVIAKVHEADMVISYVVNPEVRPLIRRVISSAYTALVNFLFGLNIPYYNGPCLVRTALVKDLPIENRGYGFMMEVLVKLIKMKRSYTLVGFTCQLRQKGSTKTFRIKSISSVFCDLIRFRVVLSSFLNSRH